MAGNRSPRSSTPRLFQRSNTLPLQQRPSPSPAEVHYESYVQATVAANAKSPVEQLEQAKATPPPPPPRRHHLTATPKAEQANGHDTGSPLQSPASSEAGQTTADAQALCKIREQMALSLKRLKDLEEQVKVIPDMEVSKLIAMQHLSHIQMYMLLSSFLSWNSALCALRSSACSAVMRSCCVVNVRRPRHQVRASKTPRPSSLRRSASVPFRWRAWERACAAAPYRPA